ncbi:hypothetical protein [Limnovirga soli]|uniref:Uncharacterized protein n=1 Tax=Limnovirga soli TaxID=2656915 RepID=A0A8J8JSG5_9BACT|nr:hypothetical protein [Limnovirga soli]NNV54738.1 hypothetical protein [Limnovirga soli]
MRQFLTIILFFIFYLTASSQDKQINVDVFKKADGFVSSYILICSDTTFFAAFANCNEAEITKGRWKKSKDKIRLLPDSEDNITIKPTIVYDANSNDSFITFHVSDYFQKPFENYEIVFFDDQMKENEMVANENGILRIPKKKYAAYLLRDEYNAMKIGSYLVNNVHFLWNGLSDVRVKLNYPIEILTNRPSTIPFAYKGDTFIISSNQLSSTTSKFVLTKP